MALHIRLGFTKISKGKKPDNLNTPLSFPQKLKKSKQVSWEKLGRSRSYVTFGRYDQKASFLL